MRRLAWAIWLLTVALGVAISPSALGDSLGTFVAFVVFVLAFGTVGLLVASRQPRNPIGWILLASGLAYVLGGITEVTREGEGEGAWTTFNAWLGTWIWIGGLAPVATFGLLLFPDGHLPSRRWRPVAWLAGFGLVAQILGLAFEPGRFEDSMIVNPVGFGGPLPEALQIVGAIALLLALIGSIASLGARYRAAGPVQRLQLKWLLYAAAVIGTAIAVTLPAEAILGDAAVEFVNTVVTLSLAAVPIAMGIAILRHRLYDVDVVIRRTLVYGALTATLAGAYLGLVLLVSLAVGESGFAVAVSTLAVAALFRPVRSRIQATVDRRFYRSRYDAALTLEAFGTRLRDELDLETLGDDLRGVVRDTMQPASVSLWLRSER
jgi:hypothetical protein